MEKQQDYLILSPEKTYDRCSIRQYKSYEAYSLFECGHITNIELSRYLDTSPFRFARCKCLPSQDTSKGTYRTIVCLNKARGNVAGAHCRCVAGLGEVCSHAAGLLFALEDFVSRGYTQLPDGPATTEILCKWNRVANAKVEPVPLQEMHIRKPDPRNVQKKARDVSKSLYDQRHH